jgi:hypothetical protein
MKTTPRTDAQVVKGIVYRDGWRSIEAHRDSEWVPADYARQIEIELNAAYETARHARNTAIDQAASVVASHDSMSGERVDPMTIWQAICDLK